jgi:hypothetical protein
LILPKSLLFTSLVGFLLRLSVLSAAAAIPAPGDTTVSSDKLLIGTFANDATFRTDYYFTQGITADLVHPALQQLWVNKILLKAGAGAINYYGLKIWYEGFTPLHILDPNIRYGDRPYAAYIYTTQYRVVNYSHKKLRITSGLDLGFIGPGAGAKGFQTKVHEWLDAPKPLGWNYQIRTDLILGYQAAIEKQLLSAGNAVELMGNARASLGTLYTHAASGLLLRTGKMNGYFQNLGVAAAANRNHLQKFQFYGQGRVEGRAVGYNATMQGGLFNKTNPHTLRADQVKHLVWQQTAGLVASYGGVSFESSVVWISPEFDGARRHKWMHFDLKIAF